MLKKSYIVTFIIIFISTYISFREISVGFFVTVGLFTVLFNVVVLEILLKWESEKENKDD